MEKPDRPAASSRPDVEHRTRAGITHLSKPHRWIEVETYRAVANETDEVLKYLRPMDPLNKDMYYRVRKQKLRSTAKRAARFIYLNRTGFNGLYRVNQKGDFNVPYGSPGSHTVVDQNNLHACADRLNAAGVEINAGDFEETVSAAKRGDLVFFDPPYVTGHNNNGFVDYNEKLFSWADQERLARVASRLKEKGVHVIISNAHHDAVIELYPGFQLQPIERFSTLAGKKSARRIVKEALFFG